VEPPFGAVRFGVSDPTARWITRMTKADALAWKAVSKEGGGTGRGDRSQFHCPDAQNDRAVRNGMRGGFAFAVPFSLMGPSP